MPQEQKLAADIDREITDVRRRGKKRSADEMLTEMESRPRKYAETFGIEPHIFESEIPATIRSLAPALHAFEKEGGTDDEIRTLFADVYPKEKIESDLSEVKRIERAIDRDDSPEDKKNALEALVLEFLMKELSNEWFPDCVIWKASPYDDIKRQTDLLMDVPGPDGGTYTMAIDVTYSRGKTFEKLKMSADEFRNNQFHDVEYFSSDTDDDRKPGRAFVPRVIAGASEEAIVRMAYLYNQWRRHSAIGSDITKEQALERLRYHELAGEVYQGFLRQIQSGYDQLRQNLKDVPNNRKNPEHFSAKRDTIKEHALYLDALRRSLEKRYRAWKTAREKFLQKNRGLEQELKTPENDVLNIILNNA